jgi:predicted nucleotidyltransferase
MAKTAQEMLFELAIDKLLQYLPPETIQNVKQIAETIASFKGQMNAIQEEIGEIKRYLRDNATADPSSDVGKGIIQIEYAGKQSET